MICYTPLPSPLSYRVTELLQALRFDLPTFSRTLGCTEQQLHDYLDHPTGANLDFLAHLLSTVDGLRAEWLLGGRGTMFDEQRRAGHNSQAGNYGNTIGFNHGLVLNISNDEAHAQLGMATRLIEQQQRQLEDKDRIIKLLEGQLKND